MEKKLVIQRAYKSAGIDWALIESFVDENGWIEHEAIIPEIHEDLLDVNEFGMRLRTLRGLGNNNGWIKVEKKMRLPGRTFFCQIILKSGRKTVGEFVHTMQQFNVLRSGYVTLDKVTHYKEICSAGNPHY